MKNLRILGCGMDPGLSLRLISSNILESKDATIDATLYRTNVSRPVAIIPCSMQRKNPRHKTETWSGALQTRGNNSQATLGKINKVHAYMFLQQTSVRRHAACSWDSTPNWAVSRTNRIKIFTYRDSVTRFLLLVFFMNQFSPNPEYSIRTVSIFCEY